MSRETDIAKEDIKLISFSAQMHSLVAVNAAHQRLTESITWRIIEPVTTQND